MGSPQQVPSSGFRWSTTALRHWQGFGENPRLLLCDEPTGALDYKTSKEILALIEQVNKEYGCTVVIVTHNDAIKNMATRILRLHDGCLIENSINSEPIPAEQLEW